MKENGEIEKNLEYLKLPHIMENHAAMTAEAAKKQLGHAEFLRSVIAAEAGARREKAAGRRISQARFPFVKTIDSFDWNHPDKINRDLVRHIFGLGFAESGGNVVFLGGTGLGKTHLAIALGHHACANGYNVRFETAIGIVNRLEAAKKIGNFGQTMRSYSSPDILCIDELGYLPVDRAGAGIIFQIISSRYERGSMIITSNREYSKWHLIFDNDKTVTSAILDRILHHAETVAIEGTSYRMREKRRS